MVPPIAEAVHRLPPSRMSLAVEREPPVEPLGLHASIGFAATAAGASIALCVLATNVLTGAAEVFGEDCLLRLSAVRFRPGRCWSALDYWPAWSGGCSWVAGWRSTGASARTFEYRGAF